MKKENIRYCTECGSVLETTFVNAGDTKVFSWDGMGASKVTLASHFNGKTGKRNIAKQLKCPNAKRFFNNHNNIIIYKGEENYI